MTERRDRATKLLSYIAETIVNGNQLVGTNIKTIRREPAPVPKLDVRQPVPEGYRNKFLKLGAKGFCDSIRGSKELLLTDTTMRDAHQSLLATRFEHTISFRLLKLIRASHRNCFSIEMWGGATFDTSMRFLLNAHGVDWLSCDRLYPTCCFKCFCVPQCGGVH